MKRILMLILVLILVLSGCQKDEKTIVLASKPMTEQFIIAEMLITLIETETDITVDYKQGIGGGTSNIHPGMVSGEIDMYPEYTGTGWMFVMKEELIADPMALYDAVKSGYQDDYDITWSSLYGFNDTFAIAMKKDLAEKYGIETYSDLAAYSNMLCFGAEYDFFEREDGFPGLVDTYGFNFDDTKELDIGLKYEAIGSGDIDVINVFSTDGKLEQYSLKVLEDDLYFFPSYYAATLVRNETLENYPELIDVIDMLSDQISNDEMTYLNYLVEVEKQDPKTVADNFLFEKGLISDQN